MEGAGLDATDTKFVQSSPHLPSCASGEGHREGSAWVGGADLGGVRNPMGDGSGLAGSSTRDHHHGPLDRLSNLTLVGVQGFQNGIVGHPHTVGRGTDTSGQTALQLWANSFCQGRPLQ